MEILKWYLPVLEPFHAKRVLDLSSLQKGFVLKVFIRTLEGSHEDKNLMTAKMLEGIEF